MHSSVPSSLSSLLLHHPSRNVRCLLTCLVHMTLLSHHPATLTTQFRSYKKNRTLIVAPHAMWWCQCQCRHISTGHCLSRLLSKWRVLSLKLHAGLPLWTDVPVGRLEGRQSCLSACEGKKWEGGSDVERDRAIGGGVHLLTSSWVESCWQWYKAAALCMSIEDCFTVFSCTQRLISDGPGLTLHVFFG